MVTAMRATSAGGSVSTAVDAYSRILLVTAASPAINVNDFEIVIPELAFAAETPQLDHGKREFESIALGLLHNLAIEVEARLVLRRRGRNQPAVVADGNKNAEIHFK